MFDQSRACFDGVSRTSHASAALDTSPVSTRSLAYPPPSHPSTIPTPSTYPGAFQLYDIDNDGYIDYDEMLKIVSSIYKMTGAMVKLPADEDTPEKRVDKLFASMDKNHDAKLTFDEFAEGSRKDPSIVQVGQAAEGTGS